MRYFFLNIIITIAFAQSITAQSIVTQTVTTQSYLTIQYEYANNLFNEGLYFDAITEFKRLKFFDKKKIYNYKANIKIGEAYKAGAKFNNAIIAFTKAKIYAKNDKEKFNSEIQIIRTNILRKTTTHALQLLNQLEKNPMSIGKRDEINYWRGWAYMFAGNWQKASNAFAFTDKYNQLKKICDKVVNKEYSVTFAKVFSYILPGAGQFYTGHYLSGLMSLGWNILWGVTTINAFSAKRVFDGIVIGNLLWFRFYRGNYQNAEKFAEENNLKIANRVLNNLQKNYKGIKP